MRLTRKELDILIDALVLFEENVGTGSDDVDPSYTEDESSTDRIAAVQQKLANEAGRRDVKIKAKP